MNHTRLSVRRTMVGVASSALLLGIAAEFQNGSPTRFGVRGIPARVACLKHAGGDR